MGKESRSRGVETGYSSGLPEKVMHMVESGDLTAVRDFFSGGIEDDQELYDYAASREDKA